jgi:hypothetical protein
MDMINAKIEKLTMMMVIEGCAGLVVVLIVLAVMYIILYS